MVERDSQTEASEDRHPLEEQGVLEGLVTESRIPALLRAIAGPQYEIAHVSVEGQVDMRPVPGTKKNIFFCFVPPEGTQSGDQFRSGFGVANMVDAVSPTGESRGPAINYTLTEPQGIRIRERIIAIGMAMQPGME